MINVDEAPKMLNERHLEMITDSQEIPLQVIQEQNVDMSCNKYFSRNYQKNR